jgi:Ca2+-binding RTX toxin-like protein
MYSAALKPFAFNSTDIDFLLAQIRFRPLFDAAGNAILNWNGTGAIYDFRHNILWNGTDVLAGAGTLAENAVSLFGTSYQNGTDLSGLRDPSGLNNNLALVNSAYGAVDQLFLRMAPTDYTGYSPILTSNTPGAYGADHVFASRFGGNMGFNQFYSTDVNGNYLDANGAIVATAAQAAIVTRLNTDYTISVGGAQHAVDGTAITIQNVVDYTPRMISLLTTTAGVVYDTWANHAGDPNPDGHQANEIYYDTNGVASVIDWGDLKTVAAGGLGQVDTQARFAGSAGTGEQFIGGLNPGVSPSNGFFVLFGQFFDHGLDFIDKGGQGATIKIAFAESDPLYGMKGPDGQPVYAITMARATVDTFNAGGPQYADHTSPFIDQSQTYGSHEQLTTLLREWVSDPATGNFHAGMSMFDGQTLETAWKNANGDMVHDTLPTLNELRAHVEATGRAALLWEDVLNLRNRDMADGHLTGGNSGSALILDMNPRFDEAHLHGFYDLNSNGVRDIGETGSANAAQNAAVDTAISALETYVKATFGANSTFGINATSHKLTLFMENLPVGTPPGTPHTLEGANAMYPFVNFGSMTVMQTNALTMTALSAEIQSSVGMLLLASVGDHYIAGDGRVNENFGLTSIHHVFHEEHNFQVGNFIDALHREAISTNNFNNLHGFQVDMSASGGSTDPVTGDYLNAAGDVAWNLDMMFNAAKLVVEMEYQHAAVDQYARNVTPNIQEFVGYSPDKDPSVTLEYAQAVFRFGHSTLRETIDTIDPTHGLTGKIMGYALRDAFLNPDKYMDLGPAAILMGMTHQQMNEVDEFVTPALNQGLLGQPLDLAAINIARGRDLGIPTLNDFREALGLARYSSWTDFGNNMQHPSSLVNFIAAYSFDGNLAKAQEIFDLVDGVIAVGANGMTTAEAFAFLEGGDQGFNQIDTWLGGLAEVHQPGGLLGETFDLVFLTQIESLMDGDRFYYLFRLAGQQFAEEVGGGQLKDIVERNTGLTHLNGNIFGYADKYYDFSAKKEVHQLDDVATETSTTSNNHKYGDIIDSDGNAIGTGALTANPTLGIYTNSGRSSAADGTLVTINGVTYIRDTRLVDNGADTGANLLNDGVNLDGTPNSGADSNEILVGTDRNDLIYAQGGDDTVYGEGGNDIIYGGYGIDRLYGGDGNDRLYGGDNPDLMDGGSGDDFIYGESSGSDINGNDQLIGGSGNDYVSGGVGIDKLSGGTGDDHVVGDGDTDPFTHGSDGNDLVEGNSGGDILYGDNGDDVLVGGADQDQMFGGNGDDIIRPGDLTGALTIGTDEVLGGDGVTDINPDGTIGFDIIDFSDNAVRAGGVKFDLSNQTNPGVTVNGTPDQVQAFQMEGVIGSAGSDTLIGGSTHLDAAGNDVTDNDWIIGGTGSDTLTGGGGNDVIIGGSIRLDALIGKYNSGYTHNNNNTGTTEADQLQDARYQGASHRVLYSEQIDNTGFLDKANAALGGVDYEKHLTELLRSDQFKDTMLGDGGSDAGNTDVVKFTGLRTDYTMEALDVSGNLIVNPGSHPGLVYAIRFTDNGTPNADPLLVRAPSDGTDLVIGVENFQFADGTFSMATVFGAPPVIDLHAFVANYVEPVGVNTISTGVAIANGATITDADTTTNASATITVTNAKAGDVLQVSGALPGGITASALDISVAGQITLTLSGTATHAQYQSALAHVRFYSTSDAPDTTTRDIAVTVSDGLITSNVAHSSVTVTGTNEAPVVAREVVTTNVTAGTAFSVADWAFLANDRDPDGNALTVSAVGSVAGGLTSASHAGSAITLVNPIGSGHSFRYTASDGALATQSGTIAVISQTSNTIWGGQNGVLGSGDSIDRVDIIVGGNGNDRIDGRGGNDIIFAGAGDDGIFQSSIEGRDFIDGGSNTPGGAAGTGDTYTLNGETGVAETFTIYAITAGQNAGLAASLGTTFQANTEIVVTRTVTVGLVTTTTVVAELDNIEEIKINSLQSTANNNNGAAAPDGGSSGGDTITVVGNFTSTSLNYSTITVNGSASDTVNITDLTSAHRIVFNSADGTGTVIGALRPQDIVNGTSGAALALDTGNTDQSLLPSFLTHDWVNIAGNGSEHRFGLETIRFVDGASFATPATDWMAGAMLAMPTQASADLHQELAPLAGFSGLAGLAQINSLPNMVSHDLMAFGTDHHMPTKLIDDYDQFDQWAHNVNGHFIP